MDGNLPRLIVFSDMPGTGKSTVAEAVARSRGVPVYSVDPIESAIVTAGIPQGPGTGLAAYLVVETLVEASLSAGVDAVVDAVNAVDDARDMWRRLAARHGAELRIVVCVVADRDLHHDRVAARSRGLAIREPTWEEVDSRMREWSPWPEPHLTLDTSRPRERLSEEVLQWLDSGG